MSTTTAPAPAMRMATCAVLIGATLACAEPRRAERALAVASDDEAAALVDRFLRALIDGHVDTAASFLCEQDEGTQARAKAFFRASQAPGSPFRATSHEIVRAEAKWLGDVPYFYVEAAYPRTSGPGTVRHGYHVRARAGCIDGLMGQPGDAATPPTTTPAEPVAPGPSADAPPAPGPSAEADAVDL